MSVQQTLQTETVSATLNSVIALPHYSPLDITSLQRADPVLRELLPFWE